MNNKNVYVLLDRRELSQYFKDNIITNKTVKIPVDSKPSTALECEKQLSRGKNPKDQIIVRIPGAPYKCKLCEESFIYRSSRSRHMKIHNTRSISDVPCKYCEKNCTCSSAVENKKRATFECGVCKKQLSTKRGLKDHMNIHTGKTPYKCKVCGKCFKHQSDHSMHMAIHDNMRPLMKCSSCDKTFYQRSALNQHILLVHTQSKYKCELCEKKINKKSNLGYHMRIHSNENPFACEICKMVFRFRSNLVRHYMLKHSSKCEFHCCLCKKKFKSGTNLRTHLNAHINPDSYKSPLKDHLQKQEENIERTEDIQATREIMLKSEEAASDNQLLRGASTNEKCKDLLEVKEERDDACGDVTIEDSIIDEKPIQILNEAMVNNTQTNQDNERKPKFEFVGTQSLDLYVNSYGQDIVIKEELSLHKPDNFSKEQDNIEYREEHRNI